MYLVYSTFNLLKSVTGMVECTYAPANPGCAFIRLAQQVLRSVQELSHTVLRQSSQVINNALDIKLLEWLEMYICYDVHV
jgi:hypothetical protein